MMYFTIFQMQMSKRYPEAIQKEKQCYCQPDDEHFKETAEKHKYNWSLFTLQPHNIQKHITVDVKNTSYLLLS